MHRVIAGFNLWALLLMGVAAALGASAHRLHVGIGMLALVLALAAQCLPFALFMGASKLLKEHMEPYQLSPDYLEQNNRLLFRMLRAAFSGSLGLLLVGILGGLAAAKQLPPLVHGVAAVACIGVVAWATLREVQVFRELHTLLARLEAELPERRLDELQRERQQASAEQPPNLRARALFYVGSTLAVAVLGYRYIAGFPLPTPLVLAALAIGVALMLLAFKVGAAGGAQAGDGHPRDAGPAGQGR